MRKFDEMIQNSSGWIKDSIILLYVFFMLIFRNGLVLQVGEFKYYVFIFGVVLLFCLLTGWLLNLDQVENKDHIIK